MAPPLTQVTLPYFHIDAFTTRPFGGNPAVVMPLPQWLPDPVLQAYAAEYNQSETAFLVRAEHAGPASTDGPASTAGGYELRWFTPTQEVNFCGHATLASAWVLWERLGENAGVLRFQTRVGELRAERGPGGEVVLDFPRLDPVPAVQTPARLSELLGVPVREVFSVDSGNFSVFAVLDSETAVRTLVPDFARLGHMDDLVVTARADEGNPDDFVSRCFAPGMGLPEDPVTGSAHATLAPYWSGVLGHARLNARQVSARGGELCCEVLGHRVRVSGHAVLYAEGQVRYG